MFIDNLPNREYHAREELSTSRLHLLARSPLHFKASVRSIDPDTSRFGSAAHDAVLEGGQALLDVPPWDRRKGGATGRSWLSWLDENALPREILEGDAKSWFDRIEALTGRIPIRPSERLDIDAMVAVFRAHPEFGHIVEGRGIAERSVIGEIDGVPFRIRPDWLWDRDGVPCIDDYKTTLDAGREGFVRSIRRFRYFVQAATYTTLMEKEMGMWPRFRFVAQEKRRPYGIAIYELSDAALMNGIEVMKRDLALYRRCRESDDWPGYPGDDYLEIPLEDPFAGAEAMPDAPPRRLGVRTRTDRP